MDEALPRLAAALVGRYAVERELGAGGMATVYLAHDVRHDRPVALKVLRPELAAVIGAERFLAEIKTTANLQHPHILPLFDSGTVEGTVFYVMPYVEGESLRDRLRRERQLPVPDAVRIATEVAAALDYAHRHGVIHRDIKPENILLHDGAALVADFGIALAVSRSEGGARMTETGLSLGTPSYMSPEQAMGERTLDARTDLYALACVVYEMLTGEPPFSGSSAQVVVAKVLTEKPTSIRALRDTVPEGLERTVLTALAKLPADRFASAADFAAALASPGEAGAAGSVRLPGSTPGAGDATARGEKAASARHIGIPMAAGLVVVAATAGWLLHGATAPASSRPPQVRFTFRLGNPDEDDPFISISPDGRRVIQVRTDSAGASGVMARDLSSTDLVVIPGTDGAVADARYSPDGRWILFNRANGTWKVPSGGGPAALVADSTNDVGDGQMPDGSFLVTRNTTGIWRIPAEGGAPTQLTQIDTARHEFAHWSPQVLPGGHAFVFTNYATPVDSSRIEAYDFDTRQRTVLARGAVYPRYAAGRLFWMRGGAVWAVPFDARTLRTSGTPVPVQDSVAWTAPNGVAGYDVSPDGTLVYLHATEWGARSRIVWADRTGRETPALPDTGAFREPRISPDGSWIVLTGTEPKRDLWIYDVRRGVLSQLTHAPGAAFNAVWTPDSRSVIYTFEDPVYDLHELTIDQSVPDRAVVTTPHDKYAGAVSRDGRRLVFEEAEHPGLRLASLSDGSPPAPLGRTTGDLSHPAFSPDGRWMAYDEQAGGRTEVYVAAAEGRGGRRVVSAGGGTEPLWTKGGREIVYRNGGAFMAAPVNPSTGDVGTPVLLFRAKIVSSVSARQTRAYDVTADGSRFLLAVPVPRPDAQPVEVVTNWVAGLNPAVKR